MKISVLIPVYNVEKYLPQCLDSILKQKCKDYEVIMVDDGSKDTSGRICDEYALRNSNFKVIHQTNNGLISARRVGLREATGEYCIFCDSDDLLEENTLENIQKVAEENNKPDLILYKGYIYDGKSKKPFADPEINEGFIKDKNIIYNHFFFDFSLNSLCFKAVKKEIVDIDNDYSDFYGLNYGEDLLQSVPLVKNACTIFFLNKYLYNYRVDTGMMTKYNPAYYQSYKKVSKILKKELKSEKINLFSEKISFYILMAAYGATMQFKFESKVNTSELQLITNDILFKKAYEDVFGSNLINRLSVKHKFILNNMYKGNYRLIYFFVRLAHYKKIISNKLEKIQ